MQLDKVKQENIDIIPKKGEQSRYKNDNHLQVNPVRNKYGPPFGSADRLRKLMESKNTLEQSQPSAPFNPDYFKKQKNSETNWQQANFNGGVQTKPINYPYAQPYN